MKTLSSSANLVASGVSVAQEAAVDEAAKGALEAGAVDCACVYADVSNSL